MVKRLSDDFVCRLIRTHGAEMIAAKSKRRHLNAGSPQGSLRHRAFGALRRNCVTCGKRAARHEWSRSHDRGSLQEFATAEVRFVRFHGSSLKLALWKGMARILRRSEHVSNLRLPGVEREPVGEARLWIIES